MIVRESKWSRPGPRSIGPTRRRSTCEKDRARAKMERERCKRDRAKERKRKQMDTASEERVRQSRKSLTDLGRSDVYGESLESHYT